MKSQIWNSDFGFHVIENQQENEATVEPSYT